MQSHSVASQNHIILQFIAILWTKIDSSIACRLNVFKSNWFRIEQKCFNLPIVWLRLSRYSNTKNKCYSHIFYLPKRFFSCDCFLQDRNAYFRFSSVVFGLNWKDPQNMQTLSKMNNILLIWIPLLVEVFIEKSTKFYAFIR